MIALRLLTGGAPPRCRRSALGTPDGIDVITSNMTATPHIPSLRATVFVIRMLLLVAITLSTVAPASAAQIYYRTKLFDGGVAPYHSFRIPAIVRTNGALVAFAEGRVDNNSDWGNINIVYRRSTDDGASWTGIQLLIGSDNNYAYGNPTAVFDPSRGSNGRLWVFFNRWSSSLTAPGGTGHRKTFSMYSDSGGLAWSTPVDRTTELGGDSIGFDAVGPGVGIRKTKGPIVGQLVIPAAGRNFYSNSQGDNWEVRYLPTHPATSEATIVECLDGELMRNDRAVRSVWENNKRRYISYGLNGSGFDAPYPLDALLDPHCQASILRYNMNSPDRIIFLNSDSTVTRGKMKVRISYDDGITWPRSRWLYVDNPHASPNYATPDDAASAGKGGYSSMTKTHDFCIAALVEINEDTGSSTSHRSIDFHKFNLDFILNGQSEP